MKSDWCSAGIPFYRTREIVKLHECGSVDNDLFISKEYFNRIKHDFGVPKTNDIMLTAVGTIGIPYIVKEDDCFYYKDASVLCLRNFYKLNSKFFFFLILSSELREQMFSASKGTTVDTVTIEKANDYIFMLPPLKEQERIVNVIESYLSIINDLESNLQYLHDCVSITKSKILDLAMRGKLVPQDPADEPAADMLRRINHKAKIIGDNPHYPQLPENWVLTTIDSICLYRNGKTIPVSDINAEDWVLELEDVESYTGRLLQIKSKKERAISGTRHSFKSGDILFSRLRTYLNKVLLSTKDGFCSTEIIPITPFKCVIPEYLYYWLRSSLFVEYTISCGYGVKMPRLSTSDANKAIVPLPPLKEQKCIVEIIQKFQSGLDKISNSLS